MDAETNRSMSVNDAGHDYELHNFEEGVQNIKFIKKEKNEETGALDTVHDGTTNEAVLEVLIHRMKVLNAKLPSRESSLAITKLEEAMFWLNHRTADRVARGVEGTYNA